MQIDGAMPDAVPQAAGDVTGCSQGGFLRDWIQVN
jgi:hypothetical protein